MRAFIRNSVILSVLVAVVAAVGCSSSDNSTGGGAGAGGSAGAHAGSGQGGGSAGKGTTNGGSAGKSGEATAGATDAGASNGGSSEGGSAGADTGGADTAGPDNSAGAGGAPEPQACNSLTFSGAAITISNSNATPPALTYGALQAGDYHLTSGVIYSTTNQTEQFGEVAHVSIADQTATIDLVTNAGVKTEIVVVMAQPNSMPPTSVKVTCSDDPVLSQVQGQEAKASLEYGVTSTTFTVYEIPLHTSLTFTLGA
jgi:hypothetical protein